MDPPEIALKGRPKVQAFRCNRMVGRFDKRYSFNQNRHRTPLQGVLVLTGIPRVKSPGLFCVPASRPRMEKIGKVIPIALFSPACPHAHTPTRPHADTPIRRHAVLLTRRCVRHRESKFGDATLDSVRSIFESQTSSMRLGDLPAKN